MRGEMIWTFWSDVLTWYDIHLCIHLVKSLGEAKHRRWLVKPYVYHIKADQSGFYWQLSQVAAVQGFLLEWGALFFVEKQKKNFMESL